MALCQCSSYAVRDDSGSHAQPAGYGDAGGPPYNASCSFLRFTPNWYRNVVYNSVEVACVYPSNANMQVCR